MAYTTLEILLSSLYFLTLARLIWAGLWRYTSLIPALRILYWSVVLDFVTESMGVLMVEVFHYKGNTPIYLVYSHLSCIVYFLFYNATLPSMGFKINFYRLGLVLLLWFVALFTYFKNIFDINFIVYIITSAIVVLLSLYAIAYTILHRNQSKSYYIKFYLFILSVFMVDLAVKSFFDLLVYIYEFNLFDILQPIHQLICIIIYLIYHQLLFHNKDVNPSTEVLV